MYNAKQEFWKAVYETHMECIPENIKRNANKQKIKLLFKLNYLYDMNIYVVIIINKKDLNSLKIISAHKVKRKIQEKINKNES